MPEMNVNYAAVLTAALICFVLGIFWYSRLMFGRQWQEAMRIPQAEKRSKGRALGSYILTFISWLLATYVLANITKFAGVQDPGNGLIIGFLCWLGFTGAMTLMHNLNENRGAPLWLVNSGYTLLSFLISGIIFGIWN
jgi:hypothetical protein